jgi:uncharacterized membrane protein YagU involved in acid resistance
MRSTVAAGAVAGLVAGVVWGVMLTVMQTPMLIGDQRSMMSLVAHAVRSESLLVGWGAHLVVSVVLGVLLGVAARAWSRSDGDAVALGVLLGMVAWIGGWLVVMPLLLGEPPLATLLDLHNVPLAVGSFLGHVLYGAIVGGGVAWLRHERVEVATPATDVRRAA